MTETKPFSLFKARKPPVESPNKGRLGRPPGEASRINEFKARLVSTSGDKIINTLIKKALDDTDKDQMAALKMCVERLLPVSMFEEKSNGGSMPQISINISGLKGPVVETIQEITDVQG